MARVKTSSFITEISLKVDSAQERELRARFQAARQLYNNCLNEAMTRVGLVRNSESYQQAKKAYNKKERTKLFRIAREQYRYSEYDMHSYASRSAHNSRWIADKLDSRIVQTIATRSFKASERVIFGKAKNVRFKSANQFKSIENKTNACGLRWKNETVVWGQLVLQPIIDWNNPVIKHGLDSPVKYVRLLWRELNGKRRWFVQLINAGEPYQKPQNFVNPGLVGLDINISNIAFVAAQKAGLLPFAESVPAYEKEISHLQRKMSRSIRATNPECFEPNFEAQKGNRIVKKQGKYKKGCRLKNRSKNYQKIAAKKREIERKKAAYAKSQNSRLVNEILRHGNQIKTEKVSVKGWQKIYGKAISAKSPGFFQSELKRKAESAGGSFTEFSTQKTALSQTHLTGDRIKKSLSERVHYDHSGIAMQRDLFSAFLSRYVNQDRLSLQDAREEYPRLEQVLVEAWKVYDPQTANRLGVAESRKSDFSSEQFSTELRANTQIKLQGLKGISNS